MSPLRTIQHLTPEKQIDHRSFARQGKAEIPTIHEGADARKIEAKFQAGHTPKPSWKVEENQIIKRQNAILRKLQEAFENVAELLKQWKERLGDIRRKQRNHSYVEEMISQIEKQQALMGEMYREIQELAAENQQWKELAEKLNSENGLLQKQNEELLEYGNG